MKKLKLGWLVAMQSKGSAFLYVNIITAKLSEEVVNNILGFHALTGCDITYNIFFNWVWEKEMLEGF